MTMFSLREGAHEFGIDLTSAQEDAFEIFYRELIDWNSRMNLTAIVDREQVITKHFLDSLSVAPILHEQNPTRLIDIGTGAGFPGIPLKIAFPQLIVTLLEATGKKVEFLKHVVTRLDLHDIIALHSRAEDLAHDPLYRERYDVATARAVANLATLSEYALAFVRTGGIFVAQKGIDVDAELGEATHALEILGGQIRRVQSIQLPGLEPRHLVVIEKIKSTPPAYPRRAGIPERKPC